MFRKLLSFPVFFSLCLAAPAFAGGKAETCDRPLQECVASMVDKLKATGFIGVELDEKSISKIIPDTPAASAGIQVGDELVSLNGIEFDKANYEKMAKVKVPGNEVTVTIRRDGAAKNIKMVLAPMPADLMAKYVGKYVLAHTEKKEKKLANK